MPRRSYCCRAVIIVSSFRRFIVSSFRRIVVLHADRQNEYCPLKNFLNTNRAILFVFSQNIAVRVSDNQPDAPAMSSIALASETIAYSSATCACRLSVLADREPRAMPIIAIKYRNQPVTRRRHQVARSINLHDRAASRSATVEVQRRCYRSLCVPPLIYRSCT